MKIEQIYTNCLSQGAYYIESNGEVAIIDPLREVQPYINKAALNKAKIKYIFETHFHADFVSGHVTLAKISGAPIIYGPEAKPSFKAIIAEDNQEFKLGELTIKVLHTPGHTIESCTFLLQDKNGNDHAIFSGDTLFLGDVGRPDLAQKTDNLTEEDLAGLLFESLREKIMPLDDNVIVYPAHGAGSACGKNMMKQTVDSLGNQKKMNYALRADMSKDEFIKEVTEGLLSPPQYFPLNVKMNKEGYEDFKLVLKRGSKQFSANDFEKVAKEKEAIIIDVRPQDDYAKGHIPNSIFIGLNGSFAPWVGTLIADTSQPILIVAPIGAEEETITRLSRVGFDNIVGFLKNGFNAWVKESRGFDTVLQVTANTLEDFFNIAEAPIFDVRKESEYHSEHMLHAKNTPLSRVHQHLNRYPANKPFYIYCAGGYRSMIAISILKSKGVHNVIDVKNGFKSIKNTNIPISNFVCPTTF